MATVAAQINALAKRRSAALERGGIDLLTDISVLETRNKMFAQVREQRDNFEMIIWRWKCRS